MKSTFTLCVFIALVLQTATAGVKAVTTKAAAVALTQANNSPATRPVGKNGELAALEQKLLGRWWGGPCEGNYTFNPDGTFILQNFTPGQNTLTGTWSLHWDALPPTLLLTCKTSDFKKKDPQRVDEFIGKAVEVKLLELNNDAFVCRLPSNKEGMRYERRPEK
jgi:hypothetical protein